MKLFVLVLAVVWGLRTTFGATETVDGVVYSYSISNGESTIGMGWGETIPWTTSGDLILPSTLGGCPVTAINDEAFRGCCLLTSVTIPDGVRTIGEHAFDCCYSLTSVRIPSSVTSIGSRAFDICESLLSVNIPDGVTAIAEGTFCHCFSLMSVTIPDGVTTIGEEAFYGCGSLTSVVIPDGVTMIGESAFGFCSSLTSVTIPSSVTNIGEGAFAFCDSLQNLDVEPGNQNYFVRDGCLVSREGVLIAALDCETLSISEDVKRIGNCAVTSLSYLKSVRIGEGVVSIGSFAFESCGNLERISLPVSLSEIGSGAWAGCWKLCDVDLNPDNPYFKMDGVFLISKEGVLKTAFQADCHCKIPMGVVEIEDYAFWGQYQIASVDIPVGVKRIGDGAFGACRGLRDVKLPPTLEVLDSSAFEHCENLRELIIPPSVEDYKYDGFYGCENLSRLYILSPSSGAAALLRSEGTKPMVYFAGKPNAMYFWPFDTETAYRYNPKYDQKWKAYFREGQDLDFAEMDSFWGGTPNNRWVGERYPSYGIWTIINGDYNLWGDVALPGQTKGIAPYAFAFNTNLTSMTIPKSVVNFGDWSFYGCHSLRDIRFEGLPPLRISRLGLPDDVHISWVDSGVHQEWQGEFSFVFDANGGAETFEPLRVTLDSWRYVLPVATRPGFRFLGWYDAPEGGNRIDGSYTRADGRAVSVRHYYSDDTIVYAHWGQAMTPREELGLDNPAGVRQMSPECREHYSDGVYWYYLIHMWRSDYFVEIVDWIAAKDWDGRLVVPASIRGYPVERAGGLQEHSALQELVLKRGEPVSVDTLRAIFFRTPSEIVYPESVDLEDAWSFNASPLIETFGDILDENALADLWSREVERIERANWIHPEDIGALALLQRTIFPDDGFVRRWDLRQWAFAQAECRPEFALAIPFLAELTGIELTDSEYRSIVVQVEANLTTGSVSVECVYPYYADLVIRAGNVLTNEDLRDIIDRLVLCLRCHPSEECANMINSLLGYYEWRIGQLNPDEEEGVVTWVETLVENILDVADYAPEALSSLASQSLVSAFCGKSLLINDWMCRLATIAHHDFEYGDLAIEIASRLAGQQNDAAFDYMLNSIYPIIEKHPDRLWWIGWLIEVFNPSSLSDEAKDEILDYSWEITRQYPDALCDFSYILQMLGGGLTDEQRETYASGARELCLTAPDALEGYVELSLVLGRSDDDEARERLLGEYLQIASTNTLYRVNLENVADVVDAPVEIDSDGRLCIGSHPFASVGGQERVNAWLSDLFLISKEECDVRMLLEKSGKVDRAGRRLLLLDEYVAGTDPFDPDSLFGAEITVENGVPTVSWTPRLNEESERARNYVIWGKHSLGTDEPWREWEADSDCRFFKVSVEMR